MKRPFTITLALVALSWIATACDSGSGGGGATNAGAGATTKRDGGVGGEAPDPSTGAGW